MAYQKRRPASPSLTVPVCGLQSPEIAARLDELHAQYGKYALPVDQVRSLVDKQMGKRTLTSELYTMRAGR